VKLNAELGVLKKDTPTAETTKLTPQLKISTLHASQRSFKARGYLKLKQVRNFKEMVFIIDNINCINGSMTANKM